MLKPRFKTYEEMVQDFSWRIRKLDEDNPKDPTILEHKKPTPKPVIESKPEAKVVIKAEAARLSRYSSASRALDSFKVLAGLTEREMMPWNPGITAETRTAEMMAEAFGMELDEDDHPLPAHTAPVHQVQYKHSQDMGGGGARAIAKALNHSSRVLAKQHSIHSYMHELDPNTQAHKKGELAADTQHAAYKLRGAADSATSPDQHAQLHAMADRHERHSKIYSAGGRPKLEAIEEMIELADSLV